MSAREHFVADTVEALRPSLLAYARRRVEGRLDAADVVQAVAVRALEHVGELRDDQSARAWLYQIARNTIAEELRKRSRAEAREAIAEFLLEGDPEQEPPCWCAAALVPSLKPAYAEMLQRAVLHGEPLADVARALGITTNNATVRLHRAREALRMRLREHCGTTSPRSCAECGCEERGCCPRPE